MPKHRKCDANFRAMRAKLGPMAGSMTRKAATHCKQSAATPKKGGRGREGRELEKYNHLGSCGKESRTNKPNTEKNWGGELRRAELEDRRQKTKGEKI